MMEEADLGLGMVMDIGELKKTKQELRSAESRFKNMFDSNIIGVAVVNRDQVFEEANDAYLRLTGYDRGDLEAGIITAKMLQVPGHEAGYTHVEKTIQAKERWIPRRQSTSGRMAAGKRFSAELPFWKTPAAT